MKKLYEIVDLVVVRFDAEDVIATSVSIDECETLCKELDPVSACDCDGYVPAM